jgi:hypothetical protein
MHLNGLKRLERPYAEPLARVDAVITRHGNFLETLNANAEPMRNAVMTTEHGFTMSAGQYLELVGPDGVPPREVTVRVPVTDASVPVGDARACDS